MVQLMLEGFGGDLQETQAREGGSVGAWGAGRIPTGLSCITSTRGCPRSSKTLVILRVGKFVLLLGYCIQAVWCRFPLRGEELLLYSGAGQTVGFIPGLAGDVYLPVVLQTRGIALARGGAGEMGWKWWCRCGRGP